MTTLAARVVVASPLQCLSAVYDKVTRAVREAGDPRWGLPLKMHLSPWYDWVSMIYPGFGIPEGPAELHEAVELHDSLVKATRLAARWLGVELSVGALLLLATASLSALGHVHVPAQPVIRL